MNGANITIIIIGFVFIGIGFLVVKFPMLISGYNTMPKEAREKVDIKGLSRMVRNYLIGAGIATMVTPYMFIWFGWQSWAYTSPFFVVTGASILIIIKGRQYTKDAEKVVLSKSDQLLKKIRNIFLIVIVIGITTITIVSIIPASVKVETSQISISGMYGTKIPFSNIENIKLQEHIYTTLKTNGSALGPYYKGHFQVKDIGNSLLFLNSNIKPYIIITLKKGQTVILNCKSKEKTEELFEKLRINLN